MTSAARNVNIFYRGWEIENMYEIQCAGKETARPIRLYVMMTEAEVAYWDAMVYKHLTILTADVATAY